MSEKKCVLLRMQKIFFFPRSNPALLLQGYIVAVLIDIMRQMTPHHYEEYIKHFKTRTDMIDFLIEILMVFKDLVSNNVYPPDWSEMIMLQNWYRRSFNCSQVYDSGH